MAALYTAVRRLPQQYDECMLRASSVCRLFSNTTESQVIPS